MVIVATSRTVLGLRAEREYPVPPLAAGLGTASVAEVAAWPAVALFVDRARAVRPGYGKAAVKEMALAGSAPVGWGQKDGLEWGTVLHQLLQIQTLTLSTRMRLLGQHLNASRPVVCANTRAS